MIEQDFKKWFSDSGDKRHRVFSYGRLKSDDILFDIGSYTGDFAKGFVAKHKCRAYCFEPVTKFYRHSMHNLEGVDGVEIYHFGLGPKNEEIEISLDSDASSLFLTEKASNTEVVQIKRIDEFILENDIENIKVIKINIEGAEYDLLDHCLDTGIVSRFENIQVQFHTFIDDCVERRDSIRKRLSETHELTWDYPFIWENWRRR